MAWLGGVPAARADAWHLAAAAGDDAWLSKDFGTHGFVLFDARRDAVAGGQLHLFYNTDTLQAGLEGIRLADGALELSIVARGEALIAGLLVDCYQRGVRTPGRGFYASYVQLLPSLKWHPAGRHSLELVAGVRRWFFGRASATEASLTLPADTFVVEPRLNYSYWAISSPGSEWGAQVLYPRIEGLAMGVGLGLDWRTQRVAWGADVGGGQLDPRNAPGRVTLHARQWLYAGVRLSAFARLQVEEHGRYGGGEDDLTRERVGGLNPYVVPLAGLPWAAVLSERLASGRAALHLRATRTSAQEFGVGVDGAMFDDARRTGALDQYSGALGVFGFGDLRFGVVQLHAQLGYALPMSWLATSPNVSALVTAGVLIL